MSNEEIKKLILSTIEDLVGAFLYYDRQDDEELELGSIEAALEDGVVTYEEIMTTFGNCLSEHTAS